MQGIGTERRTGKIKPTAAGLASLLQLLFIPLSMDDLDVSRCPPVCAAIVPVPVCSVGPTEHNLSPNLINNYQQQQRQGEWWVGGGLREVDCRTMAHR